MERQTHPVVGGPLIGLLHISLQGNNLFSVEFVDIPCKEQQIKDLEERLAQNEDDLTQMDRGRS